MKVSTQLLVVVGLGGLVLIVGAYEASKLDADPEIIKWARRQSQMPPWSSGQVQPAESLGDEDAQAQPGGDAGQPNMLGQASRSLRSWSESGRDTLCGDLPYTDLDSILARRGHPDPR
jgi:hypothetical protein